MGLFLSNSVQRGVRVYNPRRHILNQNMGKVTPPTSSFATDVHTDLCRWLFKTVIIQSFYTMENSQIDNWREDPFKIPRRRLCAVLIWSNVLARKYSLELGLLLHSSFASFFMTFSALGDVSSNTLNLLKSTRAVTLWNTNGNPKEAWESLDLECCDVIGKK